MSSFGNIVKKEIRELLTPATILPIIIVAFLFGSLGNTIGGIEGELDEKPIIGFINNDHGIFSNITTSTILNKSDVVYNSTDPDDKEYGLEQIRNNEGVALIIITKNFSENIYNNKRGVIEIYWIMQGAGILDTLSSSIVEGLISSINREISTKLIENNSSANATIALYPSKRIDTTYFKGKELTGISPGTITRILSTQSTTIPIVMMMIIIMAGGTVISSMALEKENKTLETLLTLPVKRVSIVAGKIAASAFIGLFLAIIYMFGISYYMQSFQQGEINLANFNLILSTQDYIIIGILLFITLIAALSLCMLIGTFAKDYKSGQTLTFPIVMLALIPMFITMMKDFDTLPLFLKGLTFLIPFSHPMMAPRALIFGDYTLVLIGIIYVSIFALISIGLTVRVFNTDRLLTGGTKLSKFKSLKKRYIK